MITIDEMNGMFRAACVGNAPVVALVPGGFMQDRQPQVGTAGAYAVIRVDQGGIEQTSAGIFRLYTVTIAVYAAASSTVQRSIPAALAVLFDYKPLAVTPPAGNGVVMIAPRNLDQRVARDMRSGVDVVPVISQWTVKTCEARA